MSIVSHLRSRADRAGSGGAGEPARPGAPGGPASAGSSFSPPDGVGLASVSMETSPGDQVRAPVRPDRGSAPLGLRVASALALELAVIAVVWRLGLRPSGVPPWAGGLIVAGASVLVAGPLLVVWRGRPGHHWLRVWWCYRRRRVSTEKQDPVGSVGPLTGLVDLPSVRVFVDRDDRHIGALFADPFWSVVLVAEDGDDVVTRGSSAALRLDVLATALQEREIRLSAARVVRHATPAAFGTPGWSRVGMWVVLTLDPGENRPAVNGRGGGSLGAHRALASVAARVASRSVTGGVRLRLLDPAEIRAVPAMLLPARTSSQPLTARETWRDWTFGDGACVGLRVRRWPDAARVGDPLDALSGAGARAVTSSVALGHGRGGQVAINGLVRMTFDTAAAAADGVTRAVEIARAAGGRLEPMHGEHGLAIPATIPGMWR